MNDHLTKRIQIDAMGGGYSETHDGVFVYGPGAAESIEAGDLTDEQWDEVKKAVQTGELDNAKVEEIIGTK